MNGRCSHNSTILPIFCHCHSLGPVPCTNPIGKASPSPLFRLRLFLLLPAPSRLFFFLLLHLPYLSPFLLILVFFLLDILSSFTLGLYCGRGCLTSPFFIQPHSFKSCFLFFISYPPKKGPHNVLQRWLSARPARLLPVSDSVQKSYLM